MKSESLGKFKLLTDVGYFKGQEQTHESAFDQARNIVP
jgi:hypothetical protein